MDAIEPPFVGTDGADSPFLGCGREVLSALGPTLADEPVSLMLADEAGRLLHRICGDPALLRSLDAVHLAPGFCCAEQDVGTNSIGLALADRAPIVVRAEEHYAMSLWRYAAAAAPVLDPETGRLEGCVNLITWTGWSGSSSAMLLALAQTAASATESLLLARSSGRRPRPAPSTHLFDVQAPGPDSDDGTLEHLSEPWTSARTCAHDAIRAGRVVLAVGEPGSGRATVLAQAERACDPAVRIVSASPPRAEDVDAWLELWRCELANPHTAVVAHDCDLLSLWATHRLADLLATSKLAGTVALTAASFDDVAEPLRALVDTVVAVPPLRERRDDVVVLARHLARRARGRDVEMTAAVEHLLTNHAWPGNVGELEAVVRQAVLHTDLVTVADLPARLLSGSARHLTRIEAFERDEIVRVLTHGQPSMQAAADQLGLSRATLYRKLAHYDIHLHRA